MPLQINNNGTLIIDEQTAVNNLNLKSEEVSEILSNKPDFLVRWGISIFFLVLVIIVAACWFIKYPDTINARATLTSINTPKEIKTKIDGRLIKLLVAENDFVTPNEIIGWIESTANHEVLIALSKRIDSLQHMQVSPHNLNGYLIFSNEYANLGEIQTSYQVFIQAYQLFKQYLPSGYYVKKKAMLQQDITYLQLLNSNLLNQKAMQEEDFALSKETFAANEKLKDEKVISALDYRTEKSKLINKQLTLPQIAATIINNESTQHSKQKEIAELENLIAQQYNIFIEVLNTFKAQLDEWKRKYLLLSPIAGKLSYTTFLQEGQQLLNNQSICFINPSNTNYFAIVHIPQNNFGKIVTGQKVLLKFAAYPFQEFGAVEGKLGFISNIPSDSGYLAKVNLTNGLTSNYKKELQFKDGLTAQAEIITNNINLLERFYYQARGVINK